jgi:hypothetical protein
MYVEISEISNVQKIILIDTISSYLRNPVYTKKKSL